MCNRFLLLAFAKFELTLSLRGRDGRKEMGFGSVDK